jgi:hypothetical protein
MFLYWRGIMCKYMCIHAYIRTRTLEAMRQRRPESIKNNYKPKLKIGEREHIHMATPTVLLNPSHPISVAHQKKKNQECCVISSCFLVRGYRGGGPGRGPLQCKLLPGRLALTGASSVVATGGSLALTQKPNTQPRHTSHAYLSWGKSWT